MLAAIAAAPNDPGKFAAPAASSEANTRPPHRQHFSRPVVGYIVPDGNFRVKNGIVAGVQVAPRTLVGIGFFETARKRRLSGDGLTPEKRAKRAAVGVTLQF
jgi:hypothetical protein